MTSLNVKIFFKIQDQIRPQKVYKKLLSDHITSVQTSCSQDKGYLIYLFIIIIYFIFKITHTPVNIIQQCDSMWFLLTQPSATLFWPDVPSTGNKPLHTYQFVRDPSDLWDFVRAESESDLSEVVVHVVMAVQLYDQDQLPGGEARGNQVSRANRSEVMQSQN